MSEFIDILYSIQLSVLVLQNVRLKEAELSTIKKASIMQRLALDHVGMRREWLKNLLVLNHLAYLDLLNDGENINWVEPLKPFERLQELVVRDNNASVEERKKLHDSLKRALKVQGRANNCNVRTSRDAEIGGYGNHAGEAADIGIMISP